MAFLIDSEKRRLEKLILINSNKLRFIYVVGLNQILICLRN